MLVLMRTITCPTCGLSFETSATTNTRCRRCRKVVNIGSSPRRAARAEPDDDYYYDEEDEPASGGAGGVLVALGAAAALGLGLWWANRSATAPDEPQQPQTKPPAPQNPFGIPGI